MAPTPTHPAGSLDGRIANAWPAAEDEDDGWRHRWTYGLTRRANSSLVLTDDAAGERLTRTEAFHRARSAVPRLLLSTAIATPRLHRLLTEGAYRPAGRTLVLVADTVAVHAGTAGAGTAAGGSLSDALSDAWFDTYWAVEARRGRTDQDVWVYR